MRVKVQDRAREKNRGRKLRPRNSLGSGGRLRTKKNRPAMNSATWRHPHGSGLYTYKGSHTTQPVLQKLVSENSTTFDDIWRRAEPCSRASLRNTKTSERSTWRAQGLSSLGTKTRHDMRFACDMRLALTATSSSHHSDTRTESLRGSILRKPWSCFRCAHEAHMRANFAGNCLSRTSL